MVVIGTGQIGLGMGCDMGSNGFKNKMESFVFFFYPKARFPWYISLGSK